MPGDRFTAHREFAGNRHPPFILDGHVCVADGYPRADWVLNARAAGEGTVRRGRTAERVTVVELPAEQAKPILRAFLNELPGGVGFYERAGLVDDGTPDEFEALAGRWAVFRRDPVISP